MVNGIQNAPPTDLLGMGSAPTQSPMEQALGQLQAEFLSSLDKVIPELVPLIPGEGSPTSINSPKAQQNDVLTTMGAQTFLNMPSPWSKETREKADDLFAAKVGGNRNQNPNQLLEQK